MRAEDLASLLTERVARMGGAAYPAVYLFGIEYAAPLEGRNLREIAAAAGLSPNYGTEIAKGRRLAPHVELKKWS